MKYVYWLFLLLILIPESLAGGEWSLDKYIRSIEKKHHLPKNIIHAIIKVESNGNVMAINHNDGTKSQKRKNKIVKSLGLMQVQFATARHMGFRGPASTLLSPTVNIEYGARYLKWLLDTHKGNLSRALVCFNSGPNSIPCTANLTTPYVGKVLNALYK